MKRIFLFYIILVASVSVLLAQPSAFDFTPNNTSGGIIATVTVNEMPASDADYVAAFDEAGNCAGAVKLVNYYSQAYCNLQVYGDDVTTDGIDEGINAGETFTFKLWVSATDEILDHPVDMAPVEGWDAGLNGTPVPGYDFPDEVVMAFMRSDDTEPIEGCTDPAACNYDATATVDDGSCAVEDCAGDCGGTATEGTTCDDGDAATENDTYQADCSCSGTPIAVNENADECATAVNISAAFSEECEMIGPYEQGIATVGATEPPLPACFNDGYDGTSWYTFVVPDNIAGGNPTDFIISTGAYADCTSNPLEGNADTQIAIYEGDCPGGSSTPIACNDDFSNSPPYISSVQVTLTPGTQYQIMIETFGGNLDGEFCFYVQPLADFLAGGTKDCTNCGDDVCNGVVGESFSVCSGDCPCDAGITSNSIDAGGIPGLSLNYTGYCPEDLGGSGDGLYIPFTITSSNVPMGPDNVTFLNSTLTTTVGAIYNYNFGGSPSPASGNATQNVTLIYLTPADIDAVTGGAQIVLSFTDESGECNVVEAVDANLDVTCESEPTLGYTNADACNYDATATEEDGSCNVPDAACEACDGDTVIVNDADGDGVCDEDEIAGCTDAAACNYDAGATDDDGTCAEVDCEGNCGGMATAGTPCTDADGNESMYNADCSCPTSFVPVPGCTNADACNFDADANTDDGSCVLVEAGSITLADGSMETSICVDDGVDEPIEIAVVDAGAGPNGAWVITDSEGNILALPDGPPFILDGAGVGTCLIWWLNYDDLGGAAVGVNASDLTGCFELSNSLSVNRQECEMPVLGCTDADACNYNVTATEDDDSCTYPDNDNVDCSGDCIVAVDCAGVCGGSSNAGTACTDANGDASTYADDCSCPPVMTGGIMGCTDPAACNYDADATVEDGSCATLDCADICGGDAVVGSACDDGDPNTSNDSYDADCNCVGLPDYTDCISQAGTATLVDGGSYGGMNYVCAGDCATVSAGDFLLQEGQGVKIVWHTDGEISPTNFPPVNIVASGSFYCNEAGIKQTVYATAFGALKDADDEVDFSDYCITISNTIAVNFLSPITISVDTQCDASNGNFTYTFSADGGLPECIPSESYLVTGDNFTGEVAPGETQSVGPISDGTEFTIDVTDSNGCTATFTDEVTCTKLPITLQIFTGEAVNQGNLVKWVTGTEINNNYFSLEASTNGVNFKTIATIDGQGNTNSPTAYDYLDRAAAKGTTYYRLVQTDNDGTQSKSYVIDVTRGEAAFNITDLYPIPTSDIITLQYVAPEQSNIEIEVFDLIGQTLIQYQLTADGGVAQIDINVVDLPAGVYFMSIISDADKVTQKFVIE